MPKFQIMLTEQDLQEAIMKYIHKYRSVLLENVKMEVCIIQDSIGHYTIAKSSPMRACIIIDLTIRGD